MDRSDKHETDEGSNTNSESTISTETDTGRPVPSGSPVVASTKAHSPTAGPSPAYFTDDKTHKGGLMDLPMGDVVVERGHHAPCKELLPPPPGVFFSGAGAGSSVRDIDICFLLPQQFVRVIMNTLLREVFDLLKFSTTVHTGETSFSDLLRDIFGEDYKHNNCSVLGFSMQYCYVSERRNIDIAGYREKEPADKKNIADKLQEWLGKRREDRTADVDLVEKILSEFLPAHLDEKDIDSVEYTLRYSFGDDERLKKYIAYQRKIISLLTKRKKLFHAFDRKIIELDESLPVNLHTKDLCGAEECFKSFFTNDTVKEYFNILFLIYSIYHRRIEIEDKVNDADLIDMDCLSRLIRKSIASYQEILRQISSRLMSGGLFKEKIFLGNGDGLRYHAEFSALATERAELYWQELSSFLPEDRLEPAEYWRELSKTICAIVDLSIQRPGFDLTKQSIDSAMLNPGTKVHRYFIKEYPRLFLTEKDCYGNTVFTFDDEYLNNLVDKLYIRDGELTFKTTTMDTSDKKPAALKHYADEVEGRVQLNTYAEDKCFARFYGPTSKWVDVTVYQHPEGKVFDVIPGSRSTFFLKRDIAEDIIKKGRRDSKRIVKGYCKYDSGVELTFHLPDNGDKRSYILPGQRCVYSLSVFDPDGVFHSHDTHDLGKDFHVPSVTFLISTEYLSEILDTAHKDFIRERIKEEDGIYIILSTDKGDFKYHITEKRYNDILTQLLDAEKVVINNKPMSKCIVERLRIAQEEAYRTKEIPQMVRISISEPGGQADNFIFPEETYKDLSIEWRGDCTNYFDENRSIAHKLLKLFFMYCHDDDTKITKDMIRDLLDNMKMELCYKAQDDIAEKVEFVVNYPRVEVAGKKPRSLWTAQERIDYAWNTEYTEEQREEIISTNHVVKPSTSPSV